MEPQQDTHLPCSNPQCPPLFIEPAKKPVCCLSSAQDTPASECPHDCSTDLTVDPNCNKWETADPVNTNTESKEPQDLCPLGATGEPVCVRCVDTFYLVRVCKGRLRDWGPQAQLHLTVYGLQMVTDR